MRKSLLEAYSNLKNLEEDLKDLREELDESDPIYYAKHKLLIEKIEKKEYELRDLKRYLVRLTEVCA